MKMIIAIMQTDDVEDVMNALLEKGHRVTQISTTGGFLRRGNATLLIGTEEEKIPAILAIIRAKCQTRTEMFVPLPSPEFAPYYIPEPVEVEVGGAIIFVLNVLQYHRF